MIRAELYMITHLPTGKVYYGSTWSKDNTKTHVERFAEHMAGKGGKYIKELLGEGFTPSDFSVKLMLIGTPEYVCSIEMKLSKNNLYPKGLNGNAGKNIIRTKKGQDKVSSAVSKAKTGVTKDSSDGIRNQIKILKSLKGDDRTPKQKEWDSKKSEWALDNGIKPPTLEVGSKIMNNGSVNIYVNQLEQEKYLNDGWIYGRTDDKIQWNKGKSMPFKGKKKTILTCPHCGKSGGDSQMKRWHFDNCKFKKDTDAEH